MKQILALAALAVLGLGTSFAQTVTPLLQPHQTFVDASGAPCIGCSLYTYAGGTTTSLATYTDSTGTTQNTNPIVLDTAGGANIWVSSTVTYKFVLQSATGTVVWTVDNVKANGGSVPCTTPYAIQFANVGATALTCDPTITINPASHTLMIGGAISGAAFTIKNLSAIPISWTLDVTSPATALASLGPVSFANLVPQSQDSVVMNATGGTSAPTAVSLPTGCTLAVNYNTLTHSWNCSPTIIALSTIASQPAQTVIMNATSGVGPLLPIAMPSGCTIGVNYSTATNSWTCVTAGTTTCTGTTPPWSCYSLNADGTIEEFGEIPVYASGTPYNTATIYLPRAFSQFYEIIGQSTGLPSNTGDSTTPACEAGKTKTLTYATIYMARCIVAGAGGGTFDNTMILEWHAKGK